LVYLKICDNGAGIKEENLSKIFNISFSTKRDYVGAQKGSGIGLATAKHIVESCNGKIEVKSQLNIGTTFTLIFPLIEE